MERVTKGDARCIATSPGDHPGKTVLHSLKLEHVPNCDNMQQGVAIVMPTGHKKRPKNRPLWNTKRKGFIFRKQWSNFTD